MAIYDIRSDNSLAAKVSAGVTERFGVTPRPELGEFGTDSWMRALREAGRVASEEGEIVELIGTGHGGNFPEFVVSIGGRKLQFERRGNQALYRVGLRVRVEFAKYEDLFRVAEGPSKVLLGTLKLLKLEAL